MSDNQKTNDCRRAGECSRKDCKFVHPEGWEPKVVECRKGLECNRSKCIFEHPEGWAPTVVQCRNDLKCGRSRCIFEHSEGWNWRNNASGDAEEQPRRSNRFEKRPQTMVNRGDRPVRTERGDRAERFNTSKTNDSSWKKNIDCRDGAECGKEMCSFAHPEERETKSIPTCKYGVDCHSGKCRFSHPAGWNPHKDTDCKNGVECSNGRCKFKHGDGWNPRVTTQCRFGLTCKNKNTTCKFQHSAQKRTVDI